METFLGEYNTSEIPHEVRKFEIEYLISSLPLPTSQSDFWNKIPKYSYEHVIKSLETLLHVYDNASRAIGISVSSREANTLFALYAMIHHCALSIEPASSSVKKHSSLGFYPLYFPGVTCDEDPYLIFSCPEDFERRGEIVNYFKQTYLDNPNFGYEFGGGLGSPTFVEKGVVPAPLFDFCSHLNISSKGEIYHSQSLFLFLQSLQRAHPKLLGYQLPALLEGLSYTPESPNSGIFYEAGLGYIPTLAYAAFVAHQFSSHLSLRKEEKGGFLVTVSKNEIKYSVGKSSLKSTEKPNSSSLHPTLDSEHDKMLTGYSYNRRLKQGEGKNEEGEALKLNVGPFLRQACEPKLYPYKLLAFYQNQLSSLGFVQLQTRFEVELLRSFAMTLPASPYDSDAQLRRQAGGTWFPYVRETFFPLQEELQQEGFQRQCWAFIQEGLDHYYIRQPQQRPLVFSAVFFLRLAVRLNQFMKEGVLYDPLPYLHKMLGYPTLSPEEKSYLSLHLVLAYGAQKKKLSPEEIEAFFFAWVYHKNTPLPEKWFNPLVKKEAESAILKLSTSLNDIAPKFYKQTLDALLRELGLGELPQECTLEMEAPHLFKVSLSPTSFWVINLLSGEMCNESGILQKIQAPRWTTCELYSYLFKKQDYAFKCAGEIVYFKNEHHTAFRLVSVGANSTFEQALQCFIQGRWCQYLPPEKLRDKTIPFCLLADHTHWMPIEAKDVSIMICSKKTGDLYARISEEGEIYTTTHKLWSPPPHEILSQFERPEYTLIFEKDGELSQLTFPRYVSQSREILSFEIEKGSAIYSPNKKYILSASQKKGVLGGIQQYLTLQHVSENKQKVLVPLKPLSTFTPLTSSHSIDVTDTFHSWKEAEEFLFPQKASTLVLEYDYVGDELIPLTQEGTFNLAYLYLSLREYPRAVALINSINYREDLSTESFALLRRIILFAKLHDLSPEACSVALHAWALGKGAQERAQVDKQKSIFQKKDIIVALATYERYAYRLLPELLLNAEQSAFFPKRSTSALSEYPNITSFEPKQDRKIEKHGELKLPYPTAGFETWDYFSRNQSQQNAMYLLNAAPFFFRDGQDRTYSYRKPFSLIECSVQNPSFFIEAYQIAKSGTPGEKKQLRFRLQVTGEASKSTLPAWTYLQYALKDPHSAPALPNDDYNSTRWNFVTTLQSKIESRYDRSLPERSLEETCNSFDKEEPRRALAAPILPPKEVKFSHEDLQLQIPEKAAIDNMFSFTLFKQNFKAVPPHLMAKDVDYSFEFDPEWLSIKDSEDDESPIAEEPFTNALKTDCKDFNKDYRKGKEINAQRTQYAITDVDALKTILEKRMNTLENELLDLDTAIRELANLHPQDEVKKTLLKDLHIEKEFSLKELVGLFLKRDKQLFLQENPYLGSSELINKIAQAYGLQAHPHLVIELLYNWIGLYLTLAVDKNKITNAKILCDQIIKIADEKNPKSISKTQHLAQILKPLEKPTYHVCEHPALLVIEFLTEKTLRPEQAENLIKLLAIDPETKKYKNRVTQLIMGGGKTTVIAVALLKLAAKPGRLSLFITPASQYDSVSCNLRASQQHHFGQDMETIDIQREHLTPDMCLKIEKRLEETIKRGDFLAMKAETLQSLELEFLDLIFKACEVSRISSEAIEHINCLRRILLIFRNQGDALIDEVELVLNVLQEVNFPLGGEKKLALERITLVREIFSILTSERIAVNADGTEYIDLRSKIGLLENKQTLVSKKDFQGFVSKAVAYNLAQKLEVLKLQNKPKFHDSFYRYISGKMNTTCQKMLDKPADPNYATWQKELSSQDRIDFEFLKYVKKLRFKPSKNNQEAAHQIALVKHMMLNVLPTTFEKLGKRHYGRGGPQAGGIRPYLAVDTPSRNLFGYHWEALAYHFQTVLQCKIGEEQLAWIAKTYYRQAEYFSKKEKKAFDETLEAQEFQELTGFSLVEIHDGENLKKAAHTLSRNIESLLKLEAVTAAEFVTYHLHRLTSTGCALVRMLDIVRAMSGTPYNVCCYEGELAENFEPDLGTEGQIADAALTRAASGSKSYSHILISTTIQGILEELLAHHPQRERVRMLMDSGGLFKDFRNDDIAKAIRDYLNIPVLYFQNNTPVLLKLGSDDPVVIGGTSQKAIEKTGYGIDDYFVFADEPHTTGTDIEVIPDAIGLMTLDEAMLRRTFFQTVLRLRGYFFQQDVEFVIPEYILKTFFPVQAEHKDVAIILSALIHAIKNQAIRKSQDFFRACKQKIDNIFRQNLLVDRLLPEKLTHKTLKEKFLPFKEVTIANQEDNPYDQFGALEYTVDSLESLRLYKIHKLALFRKGEPAEEIVITITEAIDEIIEAASKSPYLPKTVIESGCEDLGMHVDILVETALQIQKETKQEINQELRQELLKYQSISSGILRDEENWDNKTIPPFLKKLIELEPTHLLTLPDLFDKKHFSYTRDFTKVFSPEILVTPSWANTCQTTLPVFHKMQRPAETLLIVLTTAGYRAVVLAQKEAKQFKSFLHTNYNKYPYLKKVWLVQPNGDVYEDNPYNQLPQLEDIEKLLIQCNAFNGSIAYLEAHPSRTTEWLYGGEGSERRLDFLRLRVVDQDKLQQSLFFMSELFGHTPNIQKCLSRRVSEKIAAMTEKEIQSLKERDKPLIRLLSHRVNLMLPEQFPLLASHQVSLLRKKELIQAIPKENVPLMVNDQIPHIAAHQVPWFENSIKMTQLIDPSLIEHMTEKQFSNLSPQQIQAIKAPLLIARLDDSQYAHICGEQVELIDPTKIPLLRKKSAIQAVPQEDLRHISLPLRAKYLSPKQILDLDSETDIDLVHELTLTQSKIRFPPLPEKVSPIETLKVEEKEQNPAETSLSTDIPLFELPEAKVDGLFADFRNGAPIVDNVLTKSDQASEGVKLRRETLPYTPPKRDDDSLEANVGSTISSTPETSIKYPAKVENNPRCQRITWIVIGILALVGGGCALVGSFALIGGYSSFAPQFMIDIFEGLYSPYIVYTMTGVGGVALVGLLGLVIYQCCYSKDSQ